MEPVRCTGEDGSRTQAATDPETALRLAHLKEESYVKALTIVNFVYVFFCGAYLTSRVRILIAHFRDPRHAAWIVEPGHIAEYLIVAALGVCARRWRWFFPTQALGISVRVLGGTWLAPAQCIGFVALNRTSSSHGHDRGDHRAGGDRGAYLERLARSALCHLRARIRSRTKGNATYQGVAKAYPNGYGNRSRARTGRSGTD